MGALGSFGEGGGTVTLGRMEPRVTAWNRMELTGNCGEWRATRDNGLIARGGIVQPVNGDVIANVFTDRVIMSYGASARNHPTETPMSDNLVLDLLRGGAVATEPKVRFRLETGPSGQIRRTASD